MSLSVALPFRLYAGAAALSLGLVSSAAAAPPAAAASAGAPAAADGAEPQALATFPLAEGDRLHLALSAGRLAVMRSDSGQVVVTASLAPGQRLVRREAPGRVALRLSDPGRLSPAPVDLTLSVPAAARLHLDVGDAGLSVSGLEGAELVIRGGAGALDLDVADTRIDATSLSGSVRVVGSPSGIRVDTLSGAVAIDVPGTGRDVPLRLSTLSGDIRARAARPGPLHVSSVSGTIDLRVGSGPHPIRAASVAGDLRIDLPLDPGLRIDIAPGRGAVRALAGRVAPDGELVAGDAPHGRSLRLETVSGRIDVRAGPVVIAESRPNGE